MALGWTYSAGHFAASCRLYISTIHFDGIVLKGCLKSFYSIQGITEKQVQNVLKQKQSGATEPEKHGKARGSRYFRNLNDTCPCHMECLKFNLIGSGQVDY